ncbi:hypothetical protein V5O48_019231, partial [Marasmius crinis-equi]
HAQLSTNSTTAYLRVSHSTIAFSPITVPSPPSLPSFANIRPDGGAPQLEAPCHSELKLRSDVYLKWEVDAELLLAETRTSQMPPNRHAKQPPYCTNLDIQAAPTQSSSLGSNSAEFPQRQTLRLRSQPHNRSGYNGRGAIREELKDGGLVEDAGLENREQFSEIQHPVAKLYTDIDFTPNIDMLNEIRTTNEDYNVPHEERQ